MSCQKRFKLVRKNGMLKKVESNRVEEEVKKDILDKAGAGQWGTPELTKTYMKDTPGQSVKSFKKWLTDSK